MLIDKPRNGLKKLWEYCFMAQLNNSVYSEYYAGRTAFVVNANAKSVTDKTVNRLVDMVPAGDLFYSRSMKDSETYYRTILRRGYSRVFSGGGDGTVVNAINTMREIAKQERIERLPAVGILKLGTGNALGSVVGAKAPWLDVNHVVKGGKTSALPMTMVECDDGTLSPFAGIGYDGEILNDYHDLKEVHKDRPTAKLMSSVFGYIWAGITRTALRQINKPKNWIRVISSSDAYKMVHQDGADVEVMVPAGTVLYEGPSTLASVGSIRYFGYGFTMFPFADRRAGYLSLRICAAGVLPIVTNLYPGVWKGTYRHPQLHDFLVRDVVIESQNDMPYQVGGDASGYRRRLSFKAAPNAVEMVELAKERLPLPKGIMGLLPSPIFARG
jgi:diacylglycerol kinase family enzyme